MTPIALPELAADPEPRFVEFAKNQPEYQALPALVFQDGRVMTEWALNDEEITRLRRGERLRLWVWTFGRALQPVALEVTSEDQP
jgi:hypothetical protein